MPKHRKRIKIARRESVFQDSQQKAFTIYSDYVKQERRKINERTSNSVSVLSINHSGAHSPGPRKIGAGGPDTVSDDKHTYSSKQDSSELYSERDGQEEER